MWRDWTTHRSKESIFLAEAVERAMTDQQVWRQVSVIFEQVQTNNVLSRLILFLSPEHFRTMLSFLYTVVGGKICLSDIEELRREKMFLGEIEEMEEIMKERVASLEVFILIHELGMLETKFSYSYQIVKQDNRTALDKLAENFRLSPAEAEDVFHLIVLHEKIIHIFSREPSQPTYEYLVRHCRKYGRDADDFLDLLLAAVFLSAVIGGKLDLKVFFNFLSAERAHSPGRSTVRLQQQIEKKKKVERVCFREVGLDGDELMKLLGMKPGPEFGKTLAAVHAFARGEAEMPEVAARVRTELMERAKKFRTILQPQAHL